MLAVGGKVPYGSQYLFLLIVSRATEKLVDHDDKIAVVPRREIKLAAITL